MQTDTQPSGPPPNQKKDINKLKRWCEALGIFKKHQTTAGLGFAALVILVSVLYVGFVKSGSQTDVSKEAQVSKIVSHNVIPAKIDASTQAAQDSWNASYRYIFVKQDSSLSQAVADAANHGVTIVSTMEGIHAYVATQSTADNAKTLPETLTANPIIDSPAVIPDGSDISATATTVSPPVNTSAPTVSGNFTSGGLVTTNNGTWTSSYNLTYNQTWNICSASTASSCLARSSGGNNSSFTIPAGSNGKYVQVAVKACVIGTTACAGPVPSTYYLINATASPPPPPPPSLPVNTSTPLLSGTFIIGDTITTTTGGWTNSPTSYNYYWYICASSASCTLKANGALATFSIPSGSGGQYVKSGVVACNSAGCAAEADSALYSVATVAPPPTPPTPPPPPSPNCPSGSGTQEISVGLVRINARTDKTASGDGCGSVGGLVGVVDSGITPDPDLNIVGGVNFVDANSNCLPGTASYNDDNGHGTEVSSIIGSKDDQAEFVGVAPGVGLVSIKTQDASGSGTIQALICAVNYAISTRTDSDPTNDIGVINMSLGGITTESATATCANTTDALHLAICRAVSYGIAFAAAAGNSLGQDLKNTYPATYPEVLAVTAMNDYNGLPGGGATPTCNANYGPDDSYATYSNYADATEEPHTVAAPGSCIHSLTPSDPTNSWWSGTSESTPMVTGLIANCIYWGSCKGTGLQIENKIYTDAYNYDKANQSYGYIGDPWHRVNGVRTYGPLINLALY